MSFINPSQVRQNIFQPLHKCMCICLSLRDYPDYPRPLLVEEYVVVILSKSREKSTIGFFPGNNLPRALTTQRGSSYYLGTMNTDLKFCYIRTKVNMFSLGFYNSFFLFNLGDV